MVKLEGSALRIAYASAGLLLRHRNIGDRILYKALFPSCQSAFRKFCLVAVASPQQKYVRDGCDCAACIVRTATFTSVVSPILDIAGFGVVDVPDVIRCDARWHRYLFDNPRDPATVITYTIGWSPLEMLSKLGTAYVRADSIKALCID